MELDLFMALAQVFDDYNEEQSSRDLSMAQKKKPVKNTKTKR